MEIRFLSQVNFPALTACFNQAFSDYFVQFNATEEYLRRRWYSGRVNYDLSLGVYDEGKMIGFLITGIDQWEDISTAYNAGTGIIPAYRGKGIVGDMYQVLLPALKAAGIRQTILEVICQNVRAIKAYEKAGFRIARKLHCLKGSCPAPARTGDLRFKKPEAPRWGSYQTLQPFLWSWESTREAVDRMNGQVETWEAWVGDKLCAYSILDKAANRLVQWGFRNGEATQFGKPLLLKALQGKGEVRVNNIDARATESLDLFHALGFQPTVDQYEMQLSLS